MLFLRFLSDPPEQMKKAAFCSGAVLISTMPIKGDFIMKKTFFRIFVFIMSFIIFTGCTTPQTPSGTLGVSETESSTLPNTPSDNPDVPNSPENPDNPENPDDPPAPKEDYRILITSDMHYTSLSSYYGVGNDARLQFWVDGILAEHEKDPFDLIVILGDMSLDYWGWNGGGTYQRSPRKSETKIFMDKFVSQLPDDVPTLVLPGNHELYTNDMWKTITGNNRNESFVLGNNLFIIPDSFAGAVNPSYQGGGKNDSPYKALDMNFIRNALDAHPECTNVFLLSHHFDLSQESEEFKKLLKTDKRIVGLFSGHTHSTDVIDLGAEYRNLSILQTGNFAANGTKNTANFSWGYRDIVITKQNIVSNYIMPDSEYYVSGTKYVSTRNIKSTLTLNLGEVGIVELPKPTGGLNDGGSEIKDIIFDWYGS